MSSDDLDTAMAEGGEDPYCIHHPDLPATRHCRHCQVYYCGDCVTERSVGPNKFEFCPTCGQRCRPLQGQAAPASTARPHRFPSEISLLDAFSYPLRENNWAIIGGGAVIFGFLQLLSVIAHALPGIGLITGILSLMLGFIIWSYIAAFSFTIIRSSSQGERELPGWPGLSDTMDDLFVPLLQFVGTFVLSFGPFLAYLIYLRTQQASFDSAAGALLGAGILYAPMALLAVGMAQSLVAANPLLVITSIIKIPGAYLIACLLLAVTILIGGFLQTYASIIPFLGTFVTSFIGLYATVAQMRILGLTYYRNRRRLGWFKHV